MTVQKGIKALTGFRGAAALIVAVYHFTNAVGDSGPFVLHGGYIAVDAFFILSGYVLAYNYAGLFIDGTTAQDYKVFLIKRIARIYPAYIGILALTTLKSLFDFSGSDTLNAIGGWDIIGNLLMLTGWGLHVTPIMGVSWSVSAELFCYLLFPAIVLLVVLPSRLRILVAAVLFAIVAYMAIFVGSEGRALDIVAWDNWYPLLRALCGFGLGILSYSASISFKRVGPHVWDGLLLLCLVVLLLIWKWDYSDLGKYLLIGLIVFLAGQDTRLGRLIFGNRPVVYVGEISYSLYLIHPLLVGAGARLISKLTPIVGTNLSFLGALGLYLAIAIVASTISYWLLEIRLKNLFLSLTLRRPVKI